MIFGIVALVLASVVVVVARVRFHGPPLARLISSLINQGIRGQVTVSSVEWPISSLPSFLTGGWIPVIMHDVEVYDDGSSATGGVADPDQRKLILRVPLAEGYIAPHALARALTAGQPDIVVKNLRLPRGGWVRIEEVAQTGPGEEEGAKVISLLGAFRGKQSSGLGAGKSVGPSSIFDLRDFSFEGVTVEVSFRDYDLLLEGARGSGFLHGDFSDALAERLYFSLAPTVDRGRLDIKVYLDGDDNPDLIYDVPLHDIAVHRLAQLPTEWPRHGMARDLHWDITAKSENGASIHTRGAMLGYFDSDNGGTYDLMLWARDAGSIVHRFSKGVFGGSDLNAQAHVSGPMYAPRIDLRAGNLDVWIELAKPPPEGAPPLAVHVPVVSAWLDYATESGGVPETMAESAGGKVAASVRLSLGPFWFDLALDVLEPIYIEPHLPPALAAELMASAGAVGKPNLTGRMHVVGDGKRFGYEQLDLMLGRIHITGDIVHDEAGKMHFPELHSDVGQTRVTTRGTLNLPDGVMDMGMRVRSDDVARWLRYFEAPEEAARTMEGSARVQGTLDEPRACAALRWSGVPMVDDMVSWLNYAGEQLTVDLNRRPAQPTPCVRMGSLARRGRQSASPPADGASAGQNAGRAAGALGGSLWASGRLHLGERPRVISFVAQGNELDLGKIPLVGEIISGRMALSASTSGGFDRLDTHVRASVDGLTIAGDSYRLLAPCVSSAAQPPGTGAGEVCLHVRPDGGQDLELALAREGGGQLEVRAGIDAETGLDGRVALSALPIDNLAVLEQAGGFPIGGVVTAVMELGGTLAAPLVTGNIDWNDSWYERAFLGHTGIRITAPDAGTMRITGSLLQGDVVVRADISNQPPYDASVDLSLRRVELDRLTPELTALLLSPELQAEGVRARAWLTGDIHMEMPLLAAATTQPQVQARLTEAEVIVDYRDARGQPVPLRLRNDRATPIAIRFDGTRASLLEPVTLVGPDGARFTMEHGRVTLAPQPPGNQAGEAGADGAVAGVIGSIDVQIAGDLDMRLFEPYVSDQVSSVTGTVGVRANVSGPLEDPRVDVELQIKDTIAVRPSGQEAVVSLQQGGRITIDNEQLVLTGTEIRVADALSGQEVALDILGGIRLEDFEPVEWTLHMDGQLAGQMLLLAAPEMFSRASGTADLSVSIRGPSDAPRVDANMVFHGEQPLALTLRGLGREVRLESGEIELSDDVVELNQLAGEIGDNGRITDASGVIGLADWEVADMDISVDADSLPLRVPNEFELTANVADLRIVGDVSSGIELIGVVEVVDGRYFRRFNLISDVLSIDRGSGGGGGESQPLFADMPLLASADLDLLVDVRSFSVQNNLAAIHMSGDIMVTGTPSAPRFDGEIQVSDGEFKLPGARARFTRTWGAVTFSPSRSFPTQTPTVSLQSEGDYRDASGQYHLITFTVSGSWSRAEWDLYTSSGLNKGQTFALLFSGRTPTELRKSLGDEAPGVDPGRLETAANTSDNAADQILKDVAGDFISLLVEDTLRNITNLDVARIEIGTGSIGFHGEKEITEKIRLTGDLEQTGTGRTIDVRGEVQLSDRVSVEGGARSQVYSDPAEEDLTDYRFRAVYRRYFLWPW